STTSSIASYACLSYTPSFVCQLLSCFFFFPDTSTPEIYTLSLHDALPISDPESERAEGAVSARVAVAAHDRHARLREPELGPDRSEEHTSELQSPDHLVCRLLLEKKKKRK